MFIKFTLLQNPKMPRAKQQNNDPIYQILKTTKGKRPRRTIGIVGDLKKGFAEEGLVLLDLEGKVLAVYDINTDEVKNIPGLSREEREAANFLGDAYKRMHTFYRQIEAEPSLSEVKYLAATLAIPIERIREYAGRRSLENIIPGELRSRFGVPIGLARLRAETLRLKNPDMYLDIKGRYNYRHKKQTETFEYADNEDSESADGIIID